MKPLIALAFVAGIVFLADCDSHTLPSTTISGAPQSSRVLSGFLSLDSLQAMAAPRFRACPAATKGSFECYALYSLHELGSAPDGSSCLHSPSCYAPSDLQAAYNLGGAPTSAGKGVTVAVVDAYGDRTIAKDLALYRKTFGLPRCDSGCLTILNEDGKPSPLPKSNSGWAFEQSIDTQMVSAICPNCHIVLIEVNSTYLSDFAKGVASAVTMPKVNVISNSYGGPEFAKSGGIYDSHPGKLMLASSGDEGAGANFDGRKVSAAEPCAFRGIICIGGTSLMLSNGRRVGETVWDGLVKNRCSGNAPCATGSGCSSLVAKPSWQHDHGCKMRSETDISVDGDPYTGIVLALGGKLYSGAGGTSMSSPMVAAMFALAGDTNTATPAQLWAKGGSKAFYPVTAGTNENARVHTFICSAAILYICKAGTHMNGVYSGPTGWGTPNGLSAL